MPVMDKERSAPSAEEIEKMYKKLKELESENNTLRKQLNENLDEKIPSQEELTEKTHFHDPIDHDKLIPFLNAKAEFHENRLETLKTKRDTISAKIEKNAAAVDKLNAKADRLEDINKLLSTVAGNSQLIKSLISKNENKIEEIREKKIPARLQKIEKHNEKVAEIDRKSDVIGHKLERAVALSNTVKSFTIIGSAERRENFKNAIATLNEATRNCFDDKRTQLREDLNKTVEDYNSPKISISDKHTLQAKISKLQNQINSFDEKINKLDAANESYKEIDSEIDTAMQRTADSIQKNFENSKGMSEISEQTCLACSSNEYLKNAEMAMEENYNSIDGIINNLPENNQQINEAVREDFIPEPPPEYFDDPGNSYPEPPPQKENANWLKNMADEGKAEFGNDGLISINPEYAENLQGSQSMTFSPPDSKKVMDELVNNNIEFSAVSRNDRKVDVIVSNQDYQSLKAAAKKLEIASFVDKIGEKDERTFSASTQSFEKNMQKQLNKKQISFSSSKKHDDVKISVNESKRNQTRRITRKGSLTLVNPQFYAKLSNSERFTQLMSESEARQTIDKLDKAGIEHSAVFGGYRGAGAGVTIRQNDIKKAKSVGVNFSKFKQDNQKRKQQAQKSPEAVKKTQNRNKNTR